MESAAEEEHADRPLAAARRTAPFTVHDAAGALPFQRVIRSHAEPFLDLGVWGSRYHLFPLPFLVVTGGTTGQLFDELTHLVAKGSVD
jgi:hypothetical protein